MCEVSNWSENRCRKKITCSNLWPERQWELMCSFVKQKLNIRKHFLDRLLVTKNEIVVVIDIFFHPRTIHPLLEAREREKGREKGEGGGRKRRKWPGMIGRHRTNWKRCLPSPPPKPDWSLSLCPVPRPRLVKRCTKARLVTQHRRLVLCCRNAFSPLFPTVNVGKVWPPSPKPNGMNNVYEGRA